MPRVDLFRVGGQFTEGVVEDGDPKTGDSVKVPQKRIEMEYHCWVFLRIVGVSLANAIARIVTAFTISSLAP